MGELIKMVPLWERQGLRRFDFTTARSGRGKRQSKLQPAADHGGVLSFDFPNFAEPVGNVGLDDGSEFGLCFHDRRKGWSRLRESSWAAWALKMASSKKK